MIPGLGSGLSLSTSDLQQSSATSLTGGIVFGDYPNASPEIITNTGAGSVSQGLKWWQIAIIAAAGLAVFKRLK